jgi:hypothetical protein
MARCKCVRMAGILVPAGDRGRYGCSSEHGGRGGAITIGAAQRHAADQSSLPQVKVHQADHAALLVGRRAVAFAQRAACLSRCGRLAAESLPV